MNVMENESTIQNPEADENRLIAERRAKLAALRQGGEAYQRFPKTAPPANSEAFGDTDAAGLGGSRKCSHGRMMAKRIMGNRVRTPAGPQRPIS
jgi:lysyl-tRNA synthetase class 2